MKLKIYFKKISLGFITLLLINCQNSIPYDLIIKNKQGITLNKISGELEQGFSQISYDLSINKIGQESYDRKNKTKKRKGKNKE